MSKTRYRWGMDYNQAIELLEKGERLALVLPLRPTFDCLTAAEVLAGYLKERGKQVGLLENGLKEVLPLNKFTRLDSLPPLLHEFIISIDNSSAPVSQLRYEQGEGKLDIIFSPQSSPLYAEHISFRQGRVFCDAIIALGVADIESWNTANSVGPDFFLTTPILNIDNSGNNKNHGEVNLINTAGVSLSEMIYKLISSTNGVALGSETATLLLAGIFSSSSGFSKDPGPDALQSSAELVRLGASWKGAQDLCKESVPLSLVQLWGRAAVRSKMDSSGDILWSFLTADDFEKTSRSPKDAPLVIDHLERLFPARRITSLLWQNPATKAVETLLAGEKLALETIASRENGEFRSPHFALAKEFPAFLEAEEYITSLLKGVL